MYGIKYHGVSSAKAQQPVVVLPVLEGQVECGTCHGGVKLVSGRTVGACIDVPVMGVHYPGGRTSRPSKQAAKCIGTHSTGYVQA